MTIKEEYRPCPMCGQLLRVIEKKYVKMLPEPFYVLEPCPKCQQIEEENEKINYRQALIKSNVSDEFQDKSFEDMEDLSPSFTMAKSRAMKYCKNAKACKEGGYGIYFYGDNGRGKTALMSCMVHELVKQKYSCYIAKFEEMSKKIFNKKLTIEFLQQVDFLFIDDIGTERIIKNDDNLWITGLMFQVIDYREANKKPTIFTSNKKISELIKVGYMVKLVERMVKLGTVKLEIETPVSYRLIKKEVDLPF